MAAAYLFHIAKNHAFENGNKRTALVAAITFRKMNGAQLRVDEEGFEKLTMDLVNDRASKETAIAFFSERIEDLV